MDKSEISQRLFSLSMNAGMNQRVHHARWGMYEGREAWLQIGLAVVAAVGMILSCVPSSAYSNSPNWGAAAYVFGILLSGGSVVLAVALNVVSWSEMASNHRALFIRWSDFRAAVDAEHNRLNLESSPKLSEYVRRVIELDNWREHIDASEPPLDNDALKPFQKQEFESRGYEYPSGRPVAEIA